MIGKFKLFALVVAFTIVFSSAWAQIDISREVLFKLPPELTYGLLGMRVSADQVVFVNNFGKMVRYNLETKESFSGKIRGQRIIDFDLILGQPVFLNEEGTLGGQIKPNWPVRAYDACRIDSSDQGLILTGGKKMIFLAENATDTAEAVGLNFALPVKDGFLWSIGLKKLTGPWVVSLFDCYGNLMKEVFNFAPSFDPSGIELGPIGEEGEALLSVLEDNQRKLILLGQNGHMIWKINGPEKFCCRDLAFDGQGNLLVLEKNGQSVVLTRWTFTVPQG